MWIKGKFVRFNDEEAIIACQNIEVKTDGADIKEDGIRCCYSKQFLKNIKCYRTTPSVYISQCIQNMDNELMLDITMFSKTYKNDTGFGYTKNSMTYFYLESFK